MAPAPALDLPTLFEVISDIGPLLLFPLISRQMPNADDMQVHCSLHNSSKARCPSFVWRNGQEVWIENSRPQFRGKKPKEWVLCTRLPWILVWPLLSLTWALDLFLYKAG